MIGHNDPGMQVEVLPLYAALERGKNLSGYSWGPQKGRSEPGLVQYEGVKNRNLGR
jgi:hypothetical protein